ncbi:protein of unknown function [Legionella micdadei]|uniref:Uncharacterized protein n=1 Tax=Legionella micdadei TaxID=451 RepID=A0A098GIX1_LEGMI|nr:protein of unknown function [Legionella micdadei]
MNRATLVLQNFTSIQEIDFGDWLINQLVIFDKCVKNSYFFENFHDYFH